MGATLFDKIWNRHVVRQETTDQPAIIYVDLHLLHEISSPQAFALLEKEGWKVRRPDLTLGLVDHCAPTVLDENGQHVFKDTESAAQIKDFEQHCRRHAIPCLNLEHPKQGIVHVVAPELGLTCPGDIIVCGDSHTSTHGAFGAIAFGIGASEIADVLATQCLLQRKPKNARVRVMGTLPSNVSAKDLALAIIAKIGADGGRGHAIEYQGPAIQAMTMEERMTLCNMTIEAGSRFGLVAPDNITAEYLASRQNGSLRSDWRALDLVSDYDAIWDMCVDIDAMSLVPMMTWGTNPSMAIPVGAEIPAPSNDLEQAALSYMGWHERQSPAGRRVDHVFIGSCTNGRISDLRIVAHALAGQSIAPHLRCLIVPGSKSVQAAAEAEGLADIFRAAGAHWGAPSCSLCNAMNGDIIPAGALSVSTSNRNFPGRQGPGSRTILVSPASAAAIAIRGHL